MLGLEMNLESELEVVENELRRNLSSAERSASTIYYQLLATRWMSTCFKLIAVFGGFFLGVDFISTEAFRLSSSHSVTWAQVVGFAIFTVVALDGMFLTNTRLLSFAEARHAYDALIQRVKDSHALDPIALKIQSSDGNDDVQLLLVKRYLTLNQELNKGEAAIKEDLRESRLRQLGALSLEQERKLAAEREQREQSGTNTLETTPQE